MIDYCEICGRRMKKGPAEHTCPKKVLDGIDAAEAGSSDRDAGSKDINNISIAEDMCKELGGEE